VWRSWRELFYQAAKKGKVEEVKEILMKNPTLDVNWRGEHGRTPLHIACLNGHDSHPAIDVSLKNQYGFTPFYDACFSGHPCIRRLLKDSRVNPNEPNREGYTPLRNAADEGHDNVIKWWIASGREMNLGESGDYFTDAIGVATLNGKAGAVNLLETFKVNPGETRHAMRVELGWYDELAAEMFALVVFVSDGLLQINDTTPSPARFFSIATQLPLELQMVLCRRVVGLSKEIIPGKDTEVAFKCLAIRL